jgi:hypothetical protein
MINLSTGLRQAMLNATGMKSAFANGTLYIYSGPQPASADAAVTGTLLLKVTLAGGTFAFGSGTNGINFDAPVAGVIAKAVAEVWSGVGIAAGNAGWFRLMGNTSDTLGVSTTLSRLDGSIANSGGDMNLANIVIGVGTPLTIDVFQYTLPAN